MTDVFLSYARGDEARAEAVAAALRETGYAVWRDDELPAHRAYAEVIEERLKSARAVVVLWSAEAAKSQWVRAEADWARGAGSLVQASLDSNLPPLPFNQIQCADLSAWTARNPGGWPKLLASIEALVGPARAPAVARKGKAGAVSVCVLPFANMSGDSEQEYFSDGISEDITTDLSKVSALEVIARNTAFTFKGQSVDVCDVARKLKVTHVLEGSVRKAGTRIRVTAQLIDGKSGGHVWAERFDRDLTDIFAIQDEITKEIVAALRLTLLPEEKIAIEQRGTTSAEAYKFYLMARQYWVTGNHGDIRREERVMRICSRAVAIDPRYARAWALLAIAQSSLHYDFGSSVDDGFAAAHAALSIDPGVGEAYCAKVRRFAEQGRYQEAEAQIEKALLVTPDSWDVHKEAARTVRHLPGGIARAKVHYQRAVELMDSDFHSWALLVMCCRALGEEEGVREGAEKMVSEAERALRQDPSNGAALGIVAGGHAILGQWDSAREWIERAMLIDPDNANMKYNFACVLAGYGGDRDEALRLLARALGGAGASQIKIAETDPDLDPLRDDPRFQKIIADAKRRLKITVDTPPAKPGGPAGSLNPAAAEARPRS